MFFFLAIARSLMNSYRDKQHKGSSRNTFKATMLKWLLRTRVRDHIVCYSSLAKRMQQICHKIKYGLLSKEKDFHVINIITSQVQNVRLALLKSGVLFISSSLYNLSYSNIHLPRGELEISERCRIFHDFYSKNSLFLSEWKD